MRPTPIAVNKGIFQCFPFSSLSVVSYWFIAAVTISNYRRRWRLFPPPSPPSPMQSFTFMIFMFHWFLCTCLIAKDFHLFSHFPPPFPDWFSVSQILRDALRWFYILLKIGTIICEINSTPIEDGGASNNFYVWFRFVSSIFLHYWGLGDWKLFLKNQFRLFKRDSSMMAQRWNSPGRLHYLCRNTDKHFQKHSIGQEIKKNIQIQSCWREEIMIIKEKKKLLLIQSSPICI